MPAFRTGAARAEEASKMGGSKFATTEYFSIKDQQNPVQTIRLFTDVQFWITVSMHPSMPTRPAPDGYKGNWPQSMGAVCRMDTYKDDSGATVRTFPEHEDCYHCLTKQADGKPRKKNQRTWGIGLLRREVLDGSGKVIGIEDVMREVIRTVDGNEVPSEEPHYVIICQAYSNFWSPIAGIASMHGTCVDRDFRVRRTGFTMNDTDYQVAAHDPVGIQLNGQVVKLDLRVPEILAMYPNIPDLGEFVAHQASDDYYDRFFDIRHPQPAFGKKEDTSNTGAGGATTPVPTPSGDVSAEALAQLASRVSGGTQPAAYIPQPPVAQQPTAPATAPAAGGFLS